MAPTARVNAGLQILGDTTSLDYASRPTSFLAEMTGEKGPTPGAVLCSTAGTDIDLSQLTTPGLCRIMNVDPTNYVSIGVYDPETATFYPLLELLPGESFPIRLSRDLGWQYGTAAGTGTTGAKTQTMRVKANAAACVVLVEAFEK